MLPFDKEPSESFASRLITGTQVARNIRCALVFEIFMIRKRTPKLPVLNLLVFSIFMGALSETKLRAEEGSTIVSEVISLKYALASEVANTISNTCPKGKRIEIVTDERANSLHINAAPADMAKLRGITSKLDVCLPQFLIEAVLMETPLDHSKRSEVIGAAMLEARLVSSTNLLVVHTNTLGEPQSGFSYLATLAGDFASIETALIQHPFILLRQKPRVQVSDGESARLFVTGAYTWTNDFYYGGGSTCPPLSQRLALGKSAADLDLITSLNSDGTIAMGVHEKIEGVAGTVDLPNVGTVPVTSEMQANASATLHDNELLLLGGWVLEEPKPSFGKELKKGRIPGSSPREHAPSKELLYLIRCSRMPPTDPMQPGGQKRLTSAILGSEQLIFTNPRLMIEWNGL